MLGSLALLLALLCAAQPAVGASEGPEPRLGRRLVAPVRGLKAAAVGTNELQPVAVRDGQLLPPNSTADGSGCIMFPDRVPTGLLVEPPSEQPSPAECCRACRAAEGCNAFAYCPREGGCDVGSTYANLTVLQHRECLLLSQGLSAVETGRPVVAIPTPGLIGGAPIRATAAPLPGYEVHVGVGFFNRFDYNCPDTLSSGSCMLRGTPAELAPRCDADALCRAMVWVPAGWDYLGPNMVVLKGGEGAVMEASNGTLNQNVASYLKLAPPPPPGPPVAEDGSSSSSGGLSSGAIAGIVVGALAGATLAVAGGVVVWRRRRAAQDPPASKPASDLPRAGTADTLTDSAIDAWLPQAAGGPAAAGAGALAAQQQAPWHAATSSRVPSSRSHHIPMASSSRGARAPDSASSQDSGSGAAQRSSGIRAEASANSTGPGNGLEKASSLATSRGGVSRRSWEEGMAVLMGASSLELAASGSLVWSNDAGSPPQSPTAAALLMRVPEAPWQDWVVGIDAITFCKGPDGSFLELGTGAFGAVYKVLLDVQMYAAKVVELGQSPELHASFLREASLLRRLRHRNVVSFQGVCVSEGRGILLMELMEGGDLQSKIPAVNKATGQRAFGWAGRGRRVALDIARGLHYLHSLHLTHFDLKANNCLLTRDMTAKIADVGFTRLLSKTHHSFHSGAAGSFDYMAPELLLGRPCTESVDIYSFGVLLWEICSGEQPQRGRNRALRVPEDCPQEVADLVAECQSEDPAARPSARQLVRRLTELVAPPGSIDRR